MTFPFLEFSLLFAHLWCDQSWSIVLSFEILIMLYRLRELKKSKGYLLNFHVLGLIYSRGNYMMILKYFGLLGYCFNILLTFKVIKNNIHCWELLSLVSPCVGFYATRNTGRCHMSFYRTSYGRYSPITCLINPANLYSNLNFHGTPFSKFIFAMLVDPLNKYMKFCSNVWLGHLNIL